jgi:hypothetical protein
VTILNSRSVSSRKTRVRNGIKSWRSGEHTYFHQLNDRKLLVVFNSAVSEEDCNFTARFRISKFHTALEIRYF